MKPTSPPRIKRSRTTALLLMSTAPLWLTACQSEQAKTEEALYTSVESCIEATGEPSTCRVAFRQASEQAAEAAPQYASVEECSKDYPADQCVPQKTASGHSFIGPMMAGFFLSRMLSGLGGNNTPPPAQPAYRDNTNAWAKPEPSACNLPANANTPECRNSTTRSSGSNSGGSSGSGGLHTASRIGAGKSGLTPVTVEPNRAPTVRRSGFGRTSTARATSGG